MIPNNKEIRRKLSQEHIRYILLNNKSYFKIADEFIVLHEEFSPESIIQKISLWFEMIISPLITIVQIVFFKKLPDLFTILSIQKTLQIWLKWFEWKSHQNEIREWIKIIRSIGGPFIGCNDAKYHMYVYADGMQRIKDSLLERTGISKESTKRLK
jgi:hypothetical protein